MNQSKENHQHISNMIEAAFKLVKQAYDYRNAAKTPSLAQSLFTTDSRLIWPKNRNGNTRISEQELRFAFVEVFNQYVVQNRLNWFYSVEEPTRADYSFSGEGQRNALFDLSILDSNFNRIALIEFKANNPKKECYEKDLMKLANPAETDSYTLKYFLQIVENYNAGTVPSINKKTQMEKENLIGDSNPIYLRVYSLSDGKEIINNPIF